MKLIRFGAPGAERPGIWLASAAITLLPGDILATGAPAGIGSARNPPIYLRSGDRIECWVEGIGQQNNPVVKDMP